MKIEVIIYLKWIWGQVQGFSRSPKILGSPSWSVSVVRDSQCWDGSYMMQQGTTEPPWSLFPIWCILIWKWKFDEIWTNWGNMGQLFPFLNLDFRGDWQFYCINLIVTRRWRAMLRVQRRHDWLLLSDFNRENHSMLPTVSIDILALFPTWQCATRSKWHKDDLLRRRELQKTHTSSSSNFDCHIHCKRVQICTNPISWYFPLKSRFLIKSIAGGYSYAEGTAADFEATWTPLWSGKWRLHRTARAGKMWFLFLKLSRHADLESHLSSFCWISGYPCVCVWLCGALCGLSGFNWWYAHRPKPIFLGERFGHEGWPL